MIKAGITNVKKILATALIVAFATVMTGCGTNFGTTEDGKQNIAGNSPSLLEPIRPGTRLHSYLARS